MAEAPNAPAPITDSVASPEAESRMDSTPVVASGDPMDVSSVPPTEQERRHRKITSEVWSDFQREKNIDGSITATCNHCKRKFDGRSVKGTTHLRNHLNACNRRPKKDIRQQIIAMGKSTDDSSSRLTTYKFDPEVEREKFAKMVMKHDLPFLFAEYEYVRDWVSYICPMFKFRSRNTLRTDCTKVFDDQKAKVYRMLGQNASRISLTIDLWTPKHQRLGYCCVTCHFIDNEWILHKKIIAFQWVQCPHSGEVLAEWMKTRLMEWNIDKKLMTIVVDNAKNNEPMINHLKSWLNCKGALVYKGDLFHTRCTAHIINLIVKSGLKVINPLVEFIRNSCKFIGGSLAREQKWKIALSQTRLNNKRNVEIDTDTRWNSTYLMLESALGVREAFERLAEMDSDYKSLPSEEEWERGKRICECLKLFYDITVRLSGTKYPTANFFFNDVCNIHDQLIQWRNSEIDYIRLMAMLIQQKFDKYWESCSLVLTFGLILDPRYKMDFVEFAYRDLYGDSAGLHVDRVRRGLNELYDEYKGCVGNSSCCAFGITDETSNFQIDDIQEVGQIKSGLIKKYIQDRANTPLMVKKSELDHYLEEPQFPLDVKEELSFDILHWWKHNGPKFPILEKMARDILAIPVTTVASESAFSWGRRAIDDTRSTLTSDIVEAMICVKDWLPSLKNHTRDI